ncbi:2OG-Fe(II) oxygenase [Chitinimonas arctica]|uniref:2OG-Fe(II) oxygenase n=1 Tax=Chitinimonas arctica TaxID=2594795 RepID=A0A516SGH7_9NEIS|nr:2OG-Fe(II) oxygenase [Chitinimonas arctica]QDQ27264.1 2OG-Fe(II) oxygenase [Chitinimonas arctica]
MNDFAAQLPHTIDTLAEQGWVVLDDFLTEQEVAALLAEGQGRQAAGEFHQARVGRAEGRSVRTAVRGDNVRWLDPAQRSAASQCYWQRMEALQAELNRSLFLGIQSGEFHFAHYPVATFYKRHLDRFRDDDARVISVVCYLNDDWQTSHGGQLRLWLDENDSLDIDPRGGRLVLFLSDRFWHEVLPAQRERWSLTGWLRRSSGIPSSS